MFHESNLLEFHFIFSRMEQLYCVVEKIPHLTNPIFVNVNLFSKFTRKPTIISCHLVCDVLFDCLLLVIFIDMDFVDGTSLLLRYFPSLCLS
jgi:hypothetical protein